MTKPNAENKDGSETGDDDNDDGLSGEESDNDGDPEGGADTEANGDGGSVDDDDDGEEDEEDEEDEQVLPPYKKIKWETSFFPLPLLRMGFINYGLELFVLEVLKLETISFFNKIISSLVP